MPAIRPSRFVQDLAVTTITSLATIGALIVVTALLADGFGPDGFGAYMLARRLLATLDPVSTFAMAIAITRFVALTRDRRVRQHFLAGGALLAGVPAIGLCLVSLVSAGTLSVVFFRDPRYAGLVRATGLMVLGYSWFTSLYAWYRGADQMTKANAWQFWAIAVGPLMAGWMLAGPGREALVVLALAILLWSAALPLGWLLFRAVREAGRPPGSVLRSLVAYAAPRVPGGLAFAGLLAVGPVLAPYAGTLRDAGFVAVGQSLLRVVEGGTEAFGRVALPKVSQLFAAGEHSLLRQRVADVVAVVLHLGIYATCHLWLWAPELVRFWLGPEYQEAVDVVRIVVLGLVPYLLFVTLRSILDAVEEHAVNAANLYWALAVTIGVSLAVARAGFGAVGLAAGTSAGLGLLGASTVVSVRRRIEFPLAPLLVPQAVVLNGALALAALLARSWVVGSLPDRSLGPLVLGVEAVIGLVYAAALWKLRARWLVELRRRVLVEQEA